MTIKYSLSVTGLLDIENVSKIHEIGASMYLATNFKSACLQVWLLPELHHPTLLFRYYINSSN